MLQPAQVKIIAQHPIGKRLHGIHSSFRAACAKSKITASPDSAHQVLQDNNEIASALLLAFMGLPAASVLDSRSGVGSIAADLSKLFTKLHLRQLDLQILAPLLAKVVAHDTNEEIWKAVYAIFLGSPSTLLTPPPEGPTKESTANPVPSLVPTLKKDVQPAAVDQTPLIYKTSTIVNSSENRTNIDKELQQELSGSLYIGVPEFVEAFFGEVPHLRSIASSVFEECQKGTSPPYNAERGWQGWPSSADQDEVLPWFTQVVKMLLRLAEDSHALPRTRRKVLAKPNKPIPGSVSRRRLDVGFAYHRRTDYDWSHILVPGELKSNPNADILEVTWLDLAKYAREIFHAQDSRRFIIGFTLCGSIMRLWEFDRVGGIASSPFNIHESGFEFVLVILGYLLMDETKLGFDPTITRDGGKSTSITITRDGKPERLLIDEVMSRQSSVASRGTVCWKVYRENDISKLHPLVVKDSWQYPERGEEGELLREATAMSVVNVARYYHHETVRVDDREDNITHHVRKGLDIRKATNAFQMTVKLQKKNDMLSRMSQLTVQAARKSAPRDAADRPCEDRVHRRIIMLNHGKPLYQASSLAAMLAALEGCITGHESLYQTGSILHRDISVNNLLMDVDTESPFLIDFDYAIKVDRSKPSSVQSRTGTKVFMAIGALKGDAHTFMHDLESFFWVFFWICIHYDEPAQPGKVVPEFEAWNYHSIEALIKAKAGTISDSELFSDTTLQNFTKYYLPLRPWIDQLRRVVFPHGKRRKEEDPELWGQMRDVLSRARQDPNVRAK